MSSDALLKYHMQSYFKNEIKLKKKQTANKSKHAIHVRRERLNGCHSPEPCLRPSNDFHTNVYDGC